MYVYLTLASGKMHIDVWSLGLVVTNGWTR